jgi:hypothetical protein
MSAMGQVETHVGDLCRELGVTRQTLYRHVGPDGKLRRDGKKLLNGVWGATEQKRQLSSVACSDRCKTCEIVAKRAGFAFPTVVGVCKTAAKVGSFAVCFCDMPRLGC